MIEIPNKRLFRPDEVAEILDVSTMTIYRRIEDGTFATVKVGKQYRITRDSLDALLRSADL